MRVQLCGKVPTCGVDICTYKCDECPCTLRASTGTTGTGRNAASTGVSKGEIEFVLTGDPLVLADRNPQDRETRFNAVGKSSQGRYVFVVFTLRRKAAGQFIRPISARYMHRKEVENYERQTS